MPQDSLRSVVYRSLVTCDDPNGVVEYGTTRKSKTGSHKKEQRIEKHRTPKDTTRSLVYKEKEEELFSKGIREELHAPPPFQVLEVSKGAQKLNQMIDSWSKGLSFDGQSKDIARDLLKGALDLQESLAMLYKLQEASKYMSKMKKKHKEKFEGGMDDMIVERSNSDRFGEKDSYNGMQSGGRSLDGSSRNSVEELKKVIRESLSRQNLLPMSINEEESSFGLRRIDNFSDIPSTSSSQSSMVHSNNSASATWSVSSSVKGTKAKGPSVIAKLMGLEECPSEISPLPLEQSEIKQSLNQRRPVIDIEMPNARKAYFVSRNEDPERRTLKEIFETMQLKGLLKGNDFEGLKLQHHGDPLSKQRTGDDLPPIVVIKPLRFPCKEKECALLRKFRQEEESLYNLRKLESREEPSNRRFNTCAGVLEVENLPTKTLLHNEEALNLKEKTDEAETKETPIKRSIQEEGALKSKETRKKQAAKEPKVREKASANKMKQVSVPLSCKPQEKGTASKKLDSVHKALPNIRKPMEKKNVKSLTMSRSQNQVEVTSIKSRKPENEPIIRKNCIQRQESTTRNPISSHLQTSHSSVGPKNNATRKAKPERESKTIISVSNNLQCKQGKKVTNQTGKMESASKVTSTLLDDQLPTKEGTEDSKIEIKDHGEKHFSSLCQVKTHIIQHVSSIEFEEESKELVDQNTISETTDKKETHIKGLLLNSPSFLSCAGNLFDLKMNQQPIVLQTTSVGDVDVINTRLFLECANELMEQKSRRTSLISHSMLSTHMMNARISISLGQLLGEVCQGFDKLENYSKVVDDVLPIDSIHKMLENDIKWKGMLVGGVWDFSWEKGFSVNEADKVLAEVEKQVLNELIEEVLIDYPNSIYSLGS